MMPFIEISGKKILFIHIPKTGGGAIEAWLGRCGTIHFHSIGVPLFSKLTPQHYTYADIQCLFGDNFFDYKFSIVRNPYDRIESEYKQDYVMYINGYWKKAPTFSMWLQERVLELKSNLYARDNHLRPQIDFIGSGVDVFKYEDSLENVKNTLSLKFDMQDSTLDIVNNPVGFDASIVWDLQDRIAVNRVYHEDFVYFGYKKLFI